MKMRNKDKIVFMAHSYHAKTKSCDFLINYLQEFYEVIVHYDDSWQTKEYLDLSFIDESYKGVIFWQLLAPDKILNSIKNKNIIFFPMYDQSYNWGYFKWEKCRNFKIINFTKALHEKLKKAYYNSINVQYFIEPKEFRPGKTNEVFFWQRINAINFETIKPILNKLPFKIHIHKACDPNIDFKKPLEEDEKYFQLTYSSWLKDKNEIIEIIEGKGVYIAPRPSEGIGMGFLEAMSMGKAVVANDLPSMNEYITDGVNGYIINFDKPKDIDFSNIEEIQQNAYEYSKKGYEKWLIGRKRIIDFIEEPISKESSNFIKKVIGFFIILNKKDIIRLKFGKGGYLQIFNIDIINKAPES